MSLSSVIIMPHSPLLIPAVAKDSLKQIKATNEALDKISQTMSLKQINTFIIISSHSLDLDTAYTLNHCPQFHVDLSQFGDLVTKIETPGDLEISYRIKESTEDKLPVTLTCLEKLDYSIAIPLLYVNKYNKNFQIIPLHAANLPIKNHIEFGGEIRKIINQTSKKIGLIVAGDLARKDENNENDNSWKQANKNIIQILKNNKLNDHLKKDKIFDLKNKECIFPGLAILAGILDKTKYKTKILSYEDDLGIGLLTADLNI